ncbi:MAG: LicD family protein [Oscillospiraceae bacterium]|nr:LicD family protein [Oscillospiraceae bacterium]
MYKLNEKELTQLKHIELEILLEIDKICQKYGILYSLAWGTLIGAVRHKGFIPWDDDIDVMMERKHFDRFCEIIDQALDSRFVFVDYKKYEDYGLPFPKIVAKNTVMLETTSRFVNIPHGVWVDIFPIDETTDDLQARQKQYATSQHIKSIMLCRGHYDFGQIGIKKALYSCRRAIYQFRNKQALVTAFEENAKQYKTNSGNYLLSLCGNAGVTKNTYDRVWFQEYINMDFEGNKLMCIAGYDGLLWTTYGDYMKLPPPEERIAHHFVERLDFSAWNSQEG